MRHPSYSKNLDSLIAVVTHIAAGRDDKRTAQGIAASAQIDPKKVAYVLQSFPGLFKRYQDAKGKNGEAFYTLHVRYAEKWLDVRDDDAPPTRPRAYGDPQKHLDPQYLAMLLEFISHRAQDEVLHTIGWRTVLFGLVGAVVSAGIGAAVALFVAPHC